MRLQASGIGRAERCVRELAQWPLIDWMTVVALAGNIWQREAHGSTGRLREPVMAPDAKKLPTL